MKFTFRTATNDDQAILNNDGVSFHSNMAQEMKDLLTACNKLKVDSTAVEDTLILTLATGKERTQLKTSLEKNEKYITGGVLKLENSNTGGIFLIVRKVDDVFGRLKAKMDAFKEERESAELQPAKA